MSTTQDDIRRWLLRGLEQGATHVIVVSDSFDYSDYPIFVKAGEDARKVAAAHDDPSRMSRVMEVYSLKLDIEAQLSEHRAFHYD